MKIWKNLFGRKQQNGPVLTRGALKHFVEKYGYSIGDYSYGRPKLHFGADAKLTIGKYCSIAGSVEIFLGGNHRNDWVTTYPFPAFPYDWPAAKGISGFRVSRGDVLIGNDVWLGDGAIVLSGATIGDGAVIGARAVVGSHIPAYAVAVGNPAKVVKYRFEEEIIDQLLRIRWWDWNESKIEKFMPLILSDNVSDFVAAALACHEAPVVTADG